MRSPFVPKAPVPATPGLPFPSREGWGPAPGRSLGMPVGSIVAFSGEILGQSHKLAGATTDLQHFGWRVCDGTSVHVPAYPELFAAIGYLYGGEDSTFNLPNYKGYFLRAVDRKGLKDPDTDIRKSADGKKSSYDGVGSTQTSALQEHQHDLTQSDSSVLNGFLSPQPVLTPSGEAETGSVSKEKIVSQEETRPLNIYVYWLIKCRSDAFI